jgi:predicted Zn finger-like uncharacterized protein
MITRCPECSTLFRVVADQLKISDGWVRCGQCSHVFDGGANLQEDFALEVAKPGAEFSEADSTSPAPAAESVTTDLNLGALDVHPVQTETLPMAVDQEKTVPDVSFVRAARKESLWVRPWLRVVLTLSCVVLLLGLAVQGVVRERDRVAATWPETRPWLQILCRTLGCVIEPLKSIDAITVDSSSFNRIRGDVYRLQVILKNTARTELALPSVELTLTDTRDAAVLRRVLPPTDFATTARTIAAGAEWSASLTVNVAAAASPSHIAGYRVLAFYP